MSRPLSKSPPPYFALRKSPTEARAQGFSPVSESFTIDEGKLLLAMVRQLNGCSICLVKAEGGTQVWRDQTEIRALRPANYNEQRLSPYRK